MMAMADSGRRPGRVTGCPAFPAAVLLAVTMVLAPVADRALAGPSRLCVEAARAASARSGVPFPVLLAVSLTETGRETAGTLEPWPWAVNEGGESLWFADRGAAVAHVEAALAQGETNLDLGCFQINWRWHGAGFVSVDAMLDPLANADHAAALLAGHYRRSGSWTAAAAAYHSATPEHATRYLSRFIPIYGALGGGDALDGDMEMVAESATRAMPRAGSASANGYLLLRPGPTAGLGSLVPVAQVARPVIAGW